MKAAMCLVFLALFAMSMVDATVVTYKYYTVVPVSRTPVSVSEAKLALQAGSSLLSAGNGMYIPVEVVHSPETPANSVPLSPESRLVELVH